MVLSTLSIKSSKTLHPKRIIKMVGFMINSNKRNRKNKRKLFARDQCFLLNSEKKFSIFYSICYNFLYYKIIFLG
jgi:hypothetical protein